MTLLMLPGCSAVRDDEVSSRNKTNSEVESTDERPEFLRCDGAITLRPPGSENQWLSEYPEPPEELNQENARNFVVEYEQSYQQNRLVSSHGSDLLSVDFVDYTENNVRETRYGYIVPYTADVYITLQSERTTGTLEGSNTIEVTYFVSSSVVRRSDEEESRSPRDPASSTVVYCKR